MHKNELNGVFNKQNASIKENNKKREKRKGFLIIHINEAKLSTRWKYKYAF